MAGGVHLTTLRRDDVPCPTEAGKVTLERLDKRETGGKLCMGIDLEVPARGDDDGTFPWEGDIDPRNITRIKEAGEAEYLGTPGGLRLMTHGHCRSRETQYQRQ